MSVTGTLPRVTDATRDTRAHSRFFIVTIPAAGSSRKIQKVKVMDKSEDTTVNFWTIDLLSRWKEKGLKYAERGELEVARTYRGYLYAACVILNSLKRVEHNEAIEYHGLVADAIVKNS